MHPDLYLLIHRQREQELLTDLRHRQMAQGRPSQRVPGVAARAVARARQVLVAVDARSAPVECCPAA